MPINKTQMRLARSVIIAAVFTILIIIAFGPWEAVSIKDGSTTIYRGPLLLFIIPVVMVVMIFIGVIVYWMQPGWFFKSVSIALAVTAAGIFLTAPSILMDGVILKPDYFCSRMGFGFIL